MLLGLPGMITLANQRDNNWPISKYQETPAANQSLPTPCFCSKLINTAVNLGSGLLLSSTVLDVTGALARASSKPLYAFALLWTSYSLSFGDSDSGHNSQTPHFLLVLDASDCSLQLIQQFPLFG